MSLEEEKQELVRVKLLLAYDGSSFHGFAHQTNDVVTVAGALRSALAHLIGYEPHLTVAGRTDTGVHAWGQLVSFDVRRAVVERFGIERIQRSINKQLSPKIVVRDVAVVSSAFSARFSVSARRYRYTVLNAPLPNPFLATTAWHVAEPLHIDLMNAACSSVIGEHDFTSFCRRSGDKDLTRRVNEACWKSLGDDIVRFDIEAKAFCHQMVRSLTGTFVEIGMGKRPPSDMERVLNARNRHVAASPAPPHGLCLWEVVV